MAMSILKPFRKHDHWLKLALSLNTNLVEFDSIEPVKCQSHVNKQGYEGRLTIGDMPTH